MRIQHSHADPDMTTVEPPKSDHPKIQVLVVAYGRWPLMRVDQRGSLPRTASPLLEENTFPSYNFYIFLVTIRSVLDPC